jgi:predicted ester cyclase
MTESRRIVLTHAIEVVVGTRDEDPHLLFTEDVSAWSPNLDASSLGELEKALAERSEALSDVHLAITGLDVVGNKAIAEWVIEADHTGPVLLNDIRVEATGRRIQLGGATIAEFRERKISAFRSYFDAAAILEQMVFAD